MYCNYLLVLIFTSLTLRATTAVEEACVVRVELSERMINVMNMDKLCSCLKYEKITTSLPKAVASCSLYILNSGENVVFSADNMCECAGYQSSATLTDKLDVSETDDNVTESLYSTNTSSSTLKSDRTKTTATENTVTDAMTTTVDSFFKNATLIGNDTSKIDNLKYHSISSIKFITTEAVDLIKDAKTSNDSRSTVFTSTSDTIEMLSGADHSDTSHIELRIIDWSSSAYDTAKDITPEHFNTSTEKLGDHKENFEILTTEPFDHFSTIVDMSSDEIVRNISDILNVTDKWNIYEVTNYTSATDYYTFGKNNTNSNSDEGSHFSIKHLYLTNSTKTVNLSEVTASMDYVSEKITETPSSDFPKDIDYYYYETEDAYPDNTDKPKMYSPELKENTTAASLYISTISTNEGNENQTSTVAIPSFLDNNIIDEHSDRSTTKSDDDGTYTIEYEKNATTMKQDYTDSNKTAVTTHATISAMDTTPTSNSKNHPINKSSHNIEKDVSMTNMVLIIILSMICTALAILFIVKMIYGCLRKGSYVLPHTSSKHIEMEIKH